MTQHLSGAATKINVFQNKKKKKKPDRLIALGLTLNIVRVNLSDYL